MTCTNVIPCLSSGLAKNDKIISLPAFSSKIGGGGGGGGGDKPCTRV